MSSCLTPSVFVWLMILRFFSEHAFQNAKAVDISDMFEKTLSRSDNSIGKDFDSLNVMNNDVMTQDQQVGL